MIVKMKKVLLFMPNSAGDLEADLQVLGQLGVLHVTPFQPPKNESIDRVAEQIGQLNKAMSILESYDDEQDSEASFDELTDYSTTENGEFVLVEKIMEAEKLCVELEKSLLKLTSDKEWYSKWGNIQLDDIEQLKLKGVWLKLYLLTNKELKQVAGRDNIQVVGKLGDLNQVVLMAEEADEQLDFSEVALPQTQLDELDELLRNTNKQQEDSKQLLLQLHAQKSVLQNALDEKIQHLDLQNFQYGGFDIEKRVGCWKGFIPEDTVLELVETAEKRDWGYVIQEPDQDDMDDVPTLIRSKGWTSRIQPVMDFMGLVPGYEEMDVSKVFMLFFTFFAGILVGDAGYGLIFLVITFLVHRKQKFVKKVEFSLMYTLSTSIMFWGILTGTYFGAEAIAEFPVLSSLKINQLASFGGDAIFIQKFMFLIGAVHLTVGHLQTAWKYNNSVKAISELGWVAIVWGLYLIVNQMVLGFPSPEIMVWLFAGGGLLVALFSNPGSSFVKGVISSIGGLPLSVINGFSDIISYIRLYAVGLSTVLMALSFNEMAIGDGISTIASGIGAVVILILGHTLNMILAAMAVLVHGVRLNMLEYSGHAGVEFSGSEYHPFRLKSNKLK
ncbi:V-type ATPase 116kDa subunit family protein [uncultured Sunxiuqinia sp.]|uniref:V-type ATP synthase subunit I n=1 Tax=uncultured Sunxiuqinia sp. TaxID=1573825 RepID=UPI002AA70C7C|nr:V-type ATPase 116kDa subunit family protein [uncultured Sunxiuqinia sp.]